MDNPERFDPDQGTGNLIDSEHRARYHWVSRLAADREILDAACGVGYGIEILAAAGAKEVTGVDIDPEAVAAAAARNGSGEIVEADLLELPFESDSFDLVTCFEAIEHIDDHERALAELHRVLRADGVLVISTPNPEAYLAGNEHHVREFRPEELLAAVNKRFANVAGYRQDAWLGSRIEAAAGGAAEPHDEELIRTAAATESADFGIVVASDGELPEPAPLLAIGDTFDLRWWSGQIANREREITRLVDQERALRRRLYEVEQALLDANQELSQIPVLKHSLEVLLEQHNEFVAAHQGLLGARGKRVAAKLRRGR